MRRATKTLIGYGIILFIFVAIAMQLQFTMNATEGFQDTPQPRIVHLVISRYEEDLSWIPNIPTTAYSKGFIYNKGTPITAEYPNMELSTLPNVGREGHTYVHHVIQNYDNLPDMTIFIPGSVWVNGSKRDRLFRILEHIERKGSSVILGHNDQRTIDEAYNFSLDIWNGTSHENQQHNPENRIHPSSDRPFRTWFEKRFPGETINFVSFLGVVAASREDIRKRPIEFYQRLLVELSPVHPEVGHYTERTWKHIFSIPDEGCISV